MKKQNRFVARLTKGAVASGIAGACLVPQTYSVQPVLDRPDGGIDTALIDSIPVGPAVGTTSAATHFVSVSEAIQEWTPALEREFRKLALEEVKGTIQRDGMHRLQQLERMRNQLQAPLSTEELLMQLRRDRVLEKMADALKEYVKFFGTANQKRQSAQ
jgi:hypothetical protein